MTRDGEYSRLRVMIVRRPALTFTAAGLSVVLALAAVAASCTTAAKGQRPVQLSPCSRAFVFVDHGRPAADDRHPRERRRSRAAGRRHPADVGPENERRRPAHPVRGRTGPAERRRHRLPAPRTCRRRSHPPSPRSIRTASSRPPAAGNLYIAGGGGKGVDLRRRAPPREVLRLPALQSRRPSSSRRATTSPSAASSRPRIPPTTSASSTAISPSTPTGATGCGSTISASSTATATTSIPSSGSSPGRPTSPPIPSTSR
ncbi:MAG: hypothetical protein MZV63_14260 [Marinilabiliales bacterium]|nr:hypothetical protein [Marinilabiliales bacterium]